MTRSPLILTAVLLAASCPLSGTAQADVATAEGALAVYRRYPDAAVAAQFRGDLDALREIAAERRIARATLDAAAPEVVLSLAWPDRIGWLEAAVADGEGEWCGRLLDVLDEALPEVGSPNRGWAALVAGRAAETAATWTDEPEARERHDARAERLLERAARESFPLRDEALYRLWTRAAARNDDPAAEAWADSLVAADTGGWRVAEARISRVRRAARTGNSDAVLRESALALPEADSAELRLLVAEARAAGGDLARAALDLEGLIGKFGGSPEAREAYERRMRLADRDSSLALSLETKIELWQFLRAGPAGAAAIDSLRAAFESETAPGETRARAGEILAQGYYRAKRYAEAEGILREVLARPERAADGNLQLTLARVLRNTGRVDEAATVYRAIMTRGDADAKTAAWEVARELESARRWPEAEAAYAELLARWPNHPKRADALFRHGFALWRDGRPVEAEGRFREAFGAASREEDKERAAYWRARMLTATGRIEDARAAARAGAAWAVANDGYGVLLRAGFPEVAGTTADRESTDVVETVEELLADAAWPDAVRERLRRGEALSRLGDRRGARAEWTQAARAPAGAGLLRVLALYAARAGVYPEGVGWARKAFLDLAPHDPRRAGYRRLEYPAAFFADVDAAARLTGLDPRLVWAVMRQESLYDPTAVSRAGARGLLQMMPATFASLAEAGRIPPAPSDALFIPAVNIPAGVGYLARRIEEFSGLILPALAGYNAGADKSRQWLSESGPDDDAFFIEAIGYPETYEYVRRILWLRWMYDDLYRSKEGASSDAPGDR